MAEEAFVHTEDFLGMGGTDVDPDDGVEEDGGVVFIVIAIIPRRGFKASSLINRNPFFQSS